MEKVFKTVLVSRDEIFIVLGRDGAFARAVSMLGDGSDARFRFTRLLDIAAGKHFLLVVWIEL